MIGKRISHYQILEELGQGGMGVVYKAEDTKLKRIVALKFLPPDLTRDAEAKDRFIQEAQTASGLDHSNICTIHQIGEADDGRMFICMACYQGETLKEKIARGPLDIEEARDVVLQAAAGLAEAHKRGIIHRDIKPANIFVTENGQVKIVDFGLAKLAGQIGITKTGSTVGTVAYMSPEQGRGDDVDQRTDIWSLGVVLYEMLTGGLPFTGDHEQAVMYSIVNDEPEPIDRLRRNVPDVMQRVVAKAMQKNRNDRFSSLSEFIAELRVTARKPRAAEGHREVQSRWRMIFPYIVLAAAFVLVLISLHRFFRSEKTQHRPPVYKQVTFLGEVHFPTLSPDGRHLAYIARKDDGAFGIWVKDLETDSAIEIYSAPRCWIDSWSPDGSRLLFNAFHSDVDMGTYVIPRLGGEPQKVLDHPWPSSAWSPDGEQIAHLHPGVNEITIIDLRTGEARGLPLSFGPGQAGDVGALDWSPTHDLLLFQVDDTKHQSFWTIKPDGTKQTLLMKTEYDPKGRIINLLWSPKGDAVYYLRFSVRGQSMMDLMKIPVDTKSGTKASDPVTVLSGLHTGEPSFSLSKDGTRFLYAQETQYSNIWMITVDGEEGALNVKRSQLTTGETWKSRAEISPDGSRIVFAMSSGENMNIYSMTLPEKTDGPETIEQPRQLTFFNSLSDYPAWSPDGSEIAFYSSQGGIPRVWHMSSGGGTPKPFENTEFESYVADHLVWAPGGRIIHRTVGVRNFNVYDPATGACSPLVEADSLGYIFWPRWSPDGERVAFFWNREGEVPPMGGWVKDMTDGSMWNIAGSIMDPIGWTPDGEQIWAMQYDLTAGFGNEIFKIPVGGGEPVSWVKLPFEEMNSDGVSMTPDGRKFIYSKTERHADAWIIENFDPVVE